MIQIDFGKENILLENKNYARLRDLGKQVAEIAALPVQQRNKKLWTAVNDLKVIRPVVYVRDYPLYLLQYNDELVTTIEDPFLKEIEQALLLRIYEWKHLRVDRVIAEYIECPVVYTDSGFGIEGYTNVASNNVEKEYYDKSKHFDPVLLDMDDIDKIKTPVVEYDAETTAARLDLLKDIFDGVMLVKLFGRCNFRCATLDDVMTWTGIDEGMYHLVLKPDFMHAVIDRYIDAQIARIKQYEKLGILSSNNNTKNIGNNCPGFTSQLAAPTESGIGAKISDIWGENADQIMTGVSPEMTQEFSFEHEKKWAKQFPLYSYGCCERLDHKLDLLTASFPNLRKISSSPYSNLQSMAEQLGKKYVISFKPNSLYLAGDKPNMDLLREEFRNACELAQKYELNLVFNMKTLLTLNGEPRRLWQWCDMAMDLIHAYFDD
jgi:hypothetical protein